jgi:hypothetical protein
MEALFKQRHRRSPLRRPGPRLRMVAVMHAMRTACLVCAALYSHVSCYSATASPRTPLLFPPLQPTAAATPALLLPAVAALPPRRPQPRLRRAAASHLSLRSDTPEASRAPLPADSCPLPEASTLELFRFIIPTLTGWLSSEVMTVIEPGGDTGGEGGSGEAGGETVGEETGEGRAGGGTAGGGQDTAGRGLRASLRSPLLLRGWPSLQRLLSFVSFAGPMAFVLFGKVACYNAMTLAATSGGVITLAAHQVRGGETSFTPTSVFSPHPAPPLFPPSPPCPHDTSSRPSPRLLLALATTTRTHSYPVLDASHPAHLPTHTCTLPPSLRYWSPSSSSGVSSATPSPRPRKPTSPPASPPRRPSPPGSLRPSLPPPPVASLSA